VLDPALLRPGRFDRQIVVPNPDINGRARILDVHLRKVPKAPDVDARVIARGTPGFSGADLANIVNEAALLAARLGKKVVTMRELEAAKDKVMMGAERKSMVMSEEEKKMTAYHEGGHALVSIYSPASDPIHKATIIPRGRALGMVMRLPEADKLSYLRDKMYADLAVSMGGRVAEEIIFGHDRVSSGASSDIKYATSLARAMVTEWGMSDKIGPIFYGSNDQQEVFLGYSMGQPSRNISDDMAALIDSEVKSIVQGAHNKAHQVLTEHIDELHRIAKALLEYETLTGDEIAALVRGEDIRRNGDSEQNKPKAGKSSLPSSRSRKSDDDAAAASA
jgi:cell division protease FtsH